MVITPFTIKSRENLNRLAHDIVAAQRDGDTADHYRGLHKRFHDLQGVTAESAQLLKPA